MSKRELLLEKKKKDIDWDLYIYYKKINTKELSMLLKQTDLNFVEQGIIRLQHYWHQDKMGIE